MAKKTKKNNKGLIIGICAGVAIVVIAIIMIVITNINPKLDDSFFVSDGTKYVVSIDSSENIIDFEYDEYIPEAVHLAYFYSGDTITDAKVYLEYKDVDDAKKAADHISSQEQETIKKIELNDKYVVLTVEESQYAGMTATDAKQQVELIETLRDLDSSYEEDITADEECNNEEENCSENEGINTEETE